MLLVVILLLALIAKLVLAALLPKPGQCNLCSDLRRVMSLVGSDDLFKGRKPGAPPLALSSAPLEQDSYVRRHIADLLFAGAACMSDVWELGSGQWSASLAHQFPLLRFVATLGAEKRPAAAEYDIIFGVDTIAHLGLSFVSQAARKLRKGGRLIVMQAFRTDDFRAAPHEVRLATRLAEIGWGVPKLHCKAMWKREAQVAGLQLVEDTTIRAACAYWTSRWRLARPILLLPKMLAPHGNGPLLASWTAAHAIAGGGLTYGLLAFEKD